MKTETLTVINAAKILIAELRKVYGENIEWQELHDLENAIDNEEGNTIIGEFTHPDLNEYNYQGYKFEAAGKTNNSPENWTIRVYKETITSYIEESEVNYDFETDYDFDLNLLKEKGLLI